MIGVGEGSKIGRAEQTVLDWPSTQPAQLELLTRVLGDERKDGFSEGARSVTDDKVDQAIGRKVREQDTEIARLGRELDAATEAKGVAESAKNIAEAERDAQKSKVSDLQGRVKALEETLETKLEELRLTTEQNELLKGEVAAE